jgi:hypothetical protein
MSNLEGILGLVLGSSLGLIVIGIILMLAYRKQEKYENIKPPKHKSTNLWPPL